MIAARFVAPPFRARHALLLVLLLAVVAGSCNGQDVSVTSHPTSGPSNVEPSPSALGTASVTPIGSLPIGPCAGSALISRLIVWDGAAGSRIGSVELVNASADPCLVFALARPQLLDGTGSLLIEGGQPAASQPLLLAQGARLTTEVRVSNYCGPEPIPPVTVAFVIQDGLGRVIAAPTTATDLSGVPPCNGPAGSPGTIDMRPWTP